MEPVKARSVSAARGPAPVTGRTQSAAGGAGKSRAIRILGAAEHNLKTIDVDLPLDRLVCITGVSGSGKSTLMQDVLFNALRALKHKPADPPGKHRDITGYDLVENVVMVDQSPVGRTARSNPVSYVGAFDVIRKLFAAEPVSRERGYTAGTVQLQRWKRQVPDLQRQRLRAHRDAVPE